MNLEYVRECAISNARDEYAEDGLVSVTTFIQLSSLGLDAEWVTDQIEAGEL